jgi:hypothetical protein
MFTKADLARWKAAKTQAIYNPEMELDFLIAMQEMYIELKTLRGDNFKLLEQREALEAMAEYVAESHDNHYCSEYLEELFEKIEAMNEDFDLDLNLGDR